MVVRKIGPVNERRLALLEQYAAEEAPRPVPVERVLDAFLSPMGEVSKDHPQFVRAMGRIVSEGLLPQLIEKNFREIQVKLMSALRQALPELPPEEFAARVQFMFGVVAHVMCGPASAPGGFVAWIAPVIRFLVGGLSAPGPKQGER